MRKKRISLLLVFAMLLSMLPVTATSEAPLDVATASGEGDETTYKITLDVAGVEDGDGASLKAKLSTTRSGSYTLMEDTALSSKVEDISVTVYKTDKDTKITLTPGDIGKYYDVKLKDAEDSRLELTNGEGEIDLASGVAENDTDNKVTIHVVGKKLDKDIASEDITYPKAGGQVKLENITLDSGKVAAFYVTDKTEPDLNTEFAKWHKATKRTTVEKTLTPSVTEVSYAANHNGKALVAVIYDASGDNGRVVAKGMTKLTLTPAKTYTVTGKVYEIGGDTTPIADATITYTGKADSTEIKTNTNGEYTISGLTAKEYTITATKEGYKNTDNTVTVDLTKVPEGTTTVEADGIHLTKTSGPTASITGDQTVAEGASINLEAVVTGAQDGATPAYQWTLENVTPAGAVTLTNDTAKKVTVNGVKAGSATVKLVVTVNGTALEAATCKVTVTDGGSQAANLTLNVKYDADHQWDFKTDNQSESLTLSKQQPEETVNVNLTYTPAADVKVTVSGEGVTSDKNQATAKVKVDKGPATVTFKVTGGEITHTYTLEITATSQQTYRVSGTVYAIEDNTKPDAKTTLAGATVTCKDGDGNTIATATSKDNGEYTLDLVDGAYTLTASKTGYSSSPERLEVEVNGAALTGKDFTLTKEGGTPDPGDGPALTKLTVGDKEFTGKAIKAVMTATLAQSSDKTVDVNIVYEIDSDTTVAMAGSEGVQVKPDGEKKYVATVTPGELAEIAITLTKGGKTKDYTVVINVPKPTGSAAPVLTSESTLTENKEASETPPVIIQSTVAFDKANAEIVRNWEITGTNLTLTSVKISGTDNKTATLTFAGTAPYSTMGVKAKAVAFVKGTTEDSNVLEIRIDRDTVGQPEKYTTVDFTVEEGGKAFTDGAIITVRSGNMDIDSGKTNSEGKLTLHLELARDQTYTAVASKNGYTSHSQDFTAERHPLPFTIKEIEAEVPAVLNKSDLIGGVPSAKAEQLKLPKDETEMPANSAPIEAAVTVPDAKEAIVTFDKDQVGAMKNEDVVSSTTVTVGNNSVTLPAEALDKALTDSEIEDTENIELGVEVKETVRSSIQKPDTDQQITIKKSVSVTVYDVTTPSAPKELKINGLVKQLITIIMDVGNEIDTNPKGSYALIYIDGNTPKKISDNRWAPIGDGKISVSMSHLSEIALVSSTDAEGLNPDVAGGQILIAGKVTDERGAPAVGVTVTLNGATGNPTRTTDANGEYDFHDQGEQPYPDDVAYTLSFAKDGYYDAKDNEPLSLSGGKMYTKLNREMHKNIKVSVVDESKKGVPEATVTVTVDGQMFTFVHDPNDPVGVYSGVDLPSGEHNISANAKQQSEDGKEVIISGATILRLPMTDDFTPTITLTKAGEEGDVEYRNAGDMIEVRFTGQANTKYVVQSYTEKSSGRRYAFNLYSEVVDTFMEAGNVNEIKIWKVLDANTVIPFASNQVLAGPEQLQQDFGGSIDSKRYGVTFGETAWTPAEEK